MQRHYSQLKDEVLKLKRPAEDGIAESLAASDLIPSGTAYSIAVNGDEVSTDDLIADGSTPADEMQDPSSSLPSSDASSAAVTTSSATVNDAAADCDSLVTDDSSAAVA